MRYKITDAPFRRLASLMLICFLLVGVGAGYWGVVRADDLKEDSFLNARRQAQRELAVDRGRILAADGTVLADTEFVDGEAVRRYSYAPLSPTVGSWTLFLGRRGLEGIFDDFLSGRQGQRGLDVFDELRHEQIVGADIVTTIQMPLQVRADQLLGERAGAVVVLDARSGAVLAMASHPFYDPNVVTQGNEAAVSAIVNDPAEPVLNRATRGLYTPGSVFKVVTLAGALAQGKSSLEERFANENGIFIVEGFPIRDGSDLPARNAPYDLGHALAFSSNVTFAQLGLRLGPDGMAQIAEGFGFGEEPPLELDSATSQIGNDAFLFDQVGLASTAFGQGQLLVTPLQMALVAAGVANDGVIMQPHLVQSVRSAAGETILETRPRPWRQPLSSGVAAQVRDTMIVSAADGFARAGAPPGIAIGGKTGTAQLGGVAEPHAWFMAFAPADNPQIVVVVIVENSGSGGDVAAPIARELIGFALSGP